MKAVALTCIFLTMGCANTSNNNLAPSKPQDISTNKKPMAIANIPTDDCKHTSSTFKCVKVVSVYDGDTIFVDLPDQHPLFGKRIGVRIHGIDTPEIRTKDVCEKRKGYEAKRALQQILSSADRVDLLNVQKGKFFRILANVHADGKPVAKKLIKKKLAYPYFGKRKPVRQWCN